MGRPCRHLGADRVGIPHTGWAFDQDGIIRDVPAASNEVFSSVISHVLRYTLDLVHYQQ